MKKVLISLIYLMSLSSFASSDTLHSSFIWQLKGVTGHGEIKESDRCLKKIPCILVTLESEEDLKDIERVFPHGLEVNGVLYNFIVTGEFSISG